MRDITNEAEELKEILKCYRLINESMLRLIEADECLLETEYGVTVGTYAWQARADILPAMERIHTVANGLHSQISHIRSKIFSR